MLDLPSSPSPSSPGAPGARADLSRLIAAIGQATADDRMPQAFSSEQWDVLTGYLLPVHLTAGQVLFAQGSTDRTLYLIESGSLSVHYEDSKQRLRLAIVGAGSLVGEGAFFSHRPRSATVQAAAPSVLWALPALRHVELGNRQPAVALNMAMAAGAVLARRLGDRRRRIAAT